jgi:hypothetical protein
MIDESEEHLELCGIRLKRATVKERNPGSLPGQRTSGIRDMAEVMFV